MMNGREIMLVLALVGAMAIATSATLRASAPSQAIDCETGRTTDMPPAKGRQPAADRDQGSAYPMPSDHGGILD